MSCQVLSVRSCQTADTSEVFVVMRQPSPTVTWDSYYELQGRADLCLYLYWEIPTPPQHRKLTNMIFLPSSNYRADTIRTTGTLYTHLYTVHWHYMWKYKTELDYKVLPPQQTLLQWIQYLVKGDKSVAMNLLVFDQWRFIKQKCEAQSQ